jgi:hypothetical protein
MKKYAGGSRQNYSPLGQKEEVGQAKMTYAVSLPSSTRVGENL